MAMKRIILFLTLICGFGLLGCNKGVETMYVEGIVVNGIFYDISHQPMPAEVDDSAIIGYIESYTDTVPKKDGETNISKDLIGAPYAEVEDGIALLYKNEWYLCSPVEEAIGAPLAEPGDEGNDELPDREVTEVIEFHDKVFHKSDLSEETIEWLENYNSLSEEEQLAISSIPAELYELCGYPTAEAMEATDE